MTAYPWAELQVAYFGGEANWNYVAEPFLLVRSELIVAETGPWHGNGQGSWSAPAAGSRSATPTAPWPGADRPVAATALTRSEHLAPYPTRAVRPAQ